MWMPKRFRQLLNDQIKSNVGKLFDKAKTFTRKLFRKDAEKVEEIPSAKDRLNALLNRIDLVQKHIDPVILADEEQSEVHASVRQLAEQGFNDGVAGSKPSNLNEFATAKAAEFYRRCVATVAEKKKRLSIEIKSLQKVVNDKRGQVTLHHAYQNYLQHHNKFDERGTSWIECFLYLGCAILIFLADIPLAAEMLKWLINTPQQADEGFSILDLHKANGNVLVTAIGIALSTIYIKVSYDRFVAKKYGHDIMAKKKFEALFFGTPDAPDLSDEAEESLRAEWRKQDLESSRLTDEEKRMIKRNERTIRLIEICLLIFTLATIFILGIFRAKAWETIHSLGEETELVKEVPTSIVAATLIMITLLFSIISGVCLSISLRTWKTRRRLQRCKDEAIALESSFIDKSKNLSDVEGNHDYVLEAERNLTRAQEWINTIAALFFAYYQMGFTEGMSVPGFFMHGLDFFERVEHWRNEAVSRKINNFLN